MMMKKMTGTTTMTNPKDAKQRNTKIISTGLAVATGVGIVGVIGFRTIEDAAAQSSPAASSVDANNAEVPNLGGYSADQLQAYAQALTQEAARLSEYRDQLNKVAQQLAAQSGGSATVTSQPAKSSSANSAPKIAPVPAGQPVTVSSQPAAPSKASAAPKVAPVPATQKPAPQTNSQGSG
jgi:hypothetical protein